MSVTYNSNVINDRLQVVIDAIDAGAAGGIIQLGTTGMGLVLSSITFLDPCATISSGVLTFSGLPLADGGAANSGTAAAAQITDSNGTVIISGLTVGTSSGTEEVLISNGSGTTVIVAGQIVALVSAQITGA